MSFTSRSELCGHILAKIRVAQWDEVDALIRQIDLSEISNQRLVSYFAGKKVLVNNEYLQALSLFEGALAEFGPHLLLVADMATAYYLTGQYGHWKRFVDWSNRLFEGEIQDYDQSTGDRLRILMSKFNEEMGDLILAEKYLLQVKDYSSSRMQMRAEVHLLRIWAQYKMNPQIRDLYFSLKGMNPHTEDFEYQFEHAHAVALAEAEMDSPQLAMKNLLRLESIDDISRSLIVFDIAEIEFRKTGKVNEELLRVLRDTRPSHFYEEKLITVFKGQISPDWYQWGSQMPMGNFLRILSLLIMAPEFEEKELAFHQWTLIIQSMPKRLQNIWMELVPNGFSVRPQIALTEKGELRINQVEINLSGKPLLIDFIQLLLQHPKIKDEQACDHLWNSEPSESYLARLRQIVGRINKLALKNAAPEICSYRQGVIELLASR